MSKRNGWPWLGLAVALVVSLLVSEASACNRCGLFGTKCRFAPAHHNVAVVAAAVQPQTVVVTNVYPNPIAAQGATVYGYSQGQSYGYQAASLGNFIDPDRYLAQASKYLDTAQQLAGQGFSDFQATGTSLLSQQLAGQTEVAKIQAAAQVLEAAKSSATQPQSFSFRATVQNGQVTFDPATPVPAAEGEGMSLAGPTDYVTVLTSRCANCHGPVNPKGGLDLTKSGVLDAAMMERIVARVSTLDPDKRMPRVQDKPGTLSPSELSALVLRYEQLRRLK